MSAYPASTHRRQAPAPESGSGAFWAVAALLLGLTLAVVGFFALMMWADARDARDDAARARCRRAGCRHARARGRRSQRGAAAGELRRRRARQRRRAGRGAQALRRGDAADPGRRPGQGAHDPEGHDRRDRPGRQVQHLGVRRPRRPRPGRARPPGPDGRDDADERRLDPALDRLPRRPDRTERRLQGCRARRVAQVPLHRRRSRCLHVPLRHQAGARAHRERDVRSDRRAAEGRRCRRSTTSTCSSAASGT